MILSAINKLNITVLFKTLAGRVLDELALLFAGIGAVAKLVGFEYLWINVHKNGPERNYVGWFCVRGWLRESLCTVYMVSTAVVRNC